MLDVKCIDENKIEENYSFRRYLKVHADEKELDKQFKELHEKYFKLIDCSKCRNCCKEIGISLNEDELIKICEHYNYDIKDLKKILNEEDGEFIASPCPFLNKDNSCQIEECLPTSCKEYPYTNKDERLYHLLTIASNSATCPVVYKILEDLKKYYNFRGLK